MRVHCKFYLTLLLATLGCVTVDSKAPHTNLVEDWRDEVIYQIMIDRFEDGDPSNNFNVDYLKAVSYTHLTLPTIYSV